jgi:FtsH-binding integral membrane protein
MENNFQGGNGYDNGGYGNDSYGPQGSHQGGYNGPQGSSQSDYNDPQSGRNYGNRYQNGYSGYQGGNQYYADPYQNGQGGYAGQRYGDPAYGYERQVSGKRRKHSAAAFDMRDTMSARRYNAMIGFVTFYGLFMNFLMCTVFSSQVMAIPAGTLLMGYIIFGIAGILIMSFVKNPVVSFIGYNMLVVPLGAVLCNCISGIPVPIVTNTIGMTGAITVIMICFGILFPNFFMRIGGVLFFSLLGLLIVGLFGFFIHIPMFTYSLASTAVFTLYIGFDWAIAQRMPKNATNAMSAACNIYLDIVNIFINLLAIFGGGDD